MKPEKTTESEESKLFLISHGETLHKVQKTVTKCQESIDIASSSKNLMQGMFSIGEDLQKATSRGVKVRCLTDMLEDSDSQKAFRGLIGNPSFEIRAIPNHSWARFCIYDKEAVSIVISPLKDFSKCSLFWSNCSSLVEAYADHYEVMWLNAKCDAQVKNKIVSMPKSITQNHSRRTVQNLAV